MTWWTSSESFRHYQNLEILCYKEIHSQWVLPDLKACLNTWNKEGPGSNAYHSLLKIYVWIFLQLLPAYRGYIIDSIKKLEILDDLPISADERHHYKGLTKQKGGFVYSTRKPDQFEATDSIMCILVTSFFLLKKIES